MPWPSTIRGYPDCGEPRSWSRIFEHLRDEYSVPDRFHERTSRLGRLPGEITRRSTKVVAAFQYV
eukprot:2107653-Prorocentrum_lima.AAC.1